MQVDRVELAYTLTFTTPFHLGTGLRAGLVHRAAARDADGYLYVPGATLKGALRDRATHLARLLGLPAREPHNQGEDLAEAAPGPDTLSLIFGSRWRPGQLYFDDAAMADEDRAFFDAEGKPKRYLPRQVEARTRVSMSPLTGTARSGYLFSSEYGLPSLRFAGHIYGEVEGEPVGAGRANCSLLLLLAALLSLDRLGGNKTAGSGGLTVEVTALRIGNTDTDYRQYLEALGEWGVEPPSEG